MGEVVRIPGGGLALSRQAHFARDIRAEEAQGEAAQEGEVVRGIAQADSAGILAEGRVRTQCRPFSTPRWVRTACRMRAGRAPHCPSHAASCGRWLSLAPSPQGACCRPNCRIAAPVPPATAPRIPGVLCRVRRCRCSAPGKRRNHGWRCRPQVSISSQPSATDITAHRARITMSGRSRSVLPTTRGSGRSAKPITKLARFPSLTHSTDQNREQTPFQTSPNHLSYPPDSERVFMLRPSLRSRRAGATFARMIARYAENSSAAACGPRGVALSGLPAAQTA